MIKKMIALIAVFVMTGFCIYGIVENPNGARNKNSNTEYLRVHIRANSNDDSDQNVKFKVKERVVEYLTPIIANCTTKSQAENSLKQNLSNIERVADKVLAENGFTYKSKARINEELFPTRVYNDTELPYGYYDALIIYLGEGVGDNWWCVVYPPLCFTEGNGEYIYKSKIAQIIRDFFNKE